MGITNLIRRSVRLKDIYAVFLALTDKRTDWRAKLAAGAVLGYALLPIDLLPEYIPFAGLVDDFILVTLGLSWAKKMIPEEILNEYRQKAESAAGKAKVIFWVILGLIVLWIVLILISLFYVGRAIIN